GAERPVAIAEAAEHLRLPAAERDDLPRARGLAVAADEGDARLDGGDDGLAVAAELGEPLALAGDEPGVDARRGAERGGLGDDVLRLLQRRLAIGGRARPRGRAAPPPRRRGGPHPPPP